jgi:hypothetical protein
VKKAPETKKRQLIADLSASRREVLEAALALPPESKEVPFLGTWSAHDIVAHLIGWDYANQEAIEAIQAGRLPAFYARYDRDWRTLNAGLVAEHRRTTLLETVAAAEASHRVLLAALQAVRAEDLDLDYGVRSPGKRRVTISMLLRVGARDEHTHAEQILEFASAQTERAGGGA